MSLAEKWEEISKYLPEETKPMAQRAFYAGAEAVLELQPTAISLTQHNVNIELQVEIDRFKGQK